MSLTPARHLPVPLRQRLLAPLQMPPGVLAQAGTMPRRRTPHADRLLGPEGRRQQSKTVEPLAPLPVMPIGFGVVGSTLHLAGIDQQHLEADALQQVVAREPVHARRCHGHRRHLALPQSGRNGVPVGGEGAEAADGGVQGRRGTRGRGSAARLR